MAADAANERAARATGDVARSTLAPAAGALAAGVLALSPADAGAALATLFSDAFSEHAVPEAMLAQVVPALFRLVAPTLAAAFAGALVAGLLQTRGYLGAPAAQVRLPERASPNPAFAMLAWLVLGGLFLVQLRDVAGLASGRPTAVLGADAAVLAARVLRGLVLGACCAAIVDHVLRVRARSARLGADRVVRAPRPVPPELERLDALIDGVMHVFVDGELAIAVGPRGDEIVLLLRARGLAARALIETARRRGVRVRAGVAGPLAERALGDALSVAERSALGLQPREASA